jgi:16S rRNA (cytosine1402-N4)-methyltransferase
LTEQKGDGVHHRRPHYAGKYPRHFAEKYKELQPEKYGDEIEKIIQKGSTPAGMHIPIMVNEILEVLNIKPGMKGFDATLGYGGHTQRMLECLKGEGHLYAGDVDPIEIKKTTKRLADLGYDDRILTVKQMNFSEIKSLSEQVGKFDFILADLGVSSMQIDNPERGFSYKVNGPLDLRLNPEKGQSAAEYLATLDKDEIVAVLEENSDEPFADEIAKQIVRMEKRKKIETTQELFEAVEKALIQAKVPKDELKDSVKKSCARTFQALRIEVNKEFEVLYEFLSDLPNVLNPGGRVAILTFHSGEDRMVKQAFREYFRQGIYSDYSKDVIRPSKEECFRNPRAHSTKLRWAEKA